MMTVKFLSGIYDIFLHTCGYDTVLYCSSWTLLILTQLRKVMIFLIEIIAVASLIHAIFFVLFPALTVFGNIWGYLHNPIDIPMQLEDTIGQFICSVIYVMIFALVDTLSPNDFDLTLPVYNFPMKYQRFVSEKLKLYELTQFKHQCQLLIDAPLFPYDIGGSIMVYLKPSKRIKPRYIKFSNTFLWRTEMISIISTVILVIYGTYEFGFILQFHLGPIARSLMFHFGSTIIYLGKNFLYEPLVTTLNYYMSENHCDDMWGYFSF